MFRLELVGVVGFLLHDFEPDFANSCSLVACFCKNIVTDVGTV